MHIEDELVKWLDISIPDRSPDKIRNINIILNYYGFGEQLSPTFDDLASEFNAGTRQRVQQIIKGFRDNISVADLPVGQQIFHAIESQKFVSIVEFHQRLLQERLISEKTSIVGLLNLARNFDRCENYSVYDSDLNPVSRSVSELDVSSFLIESETISIIKKQLKKARTLPGLLGLAKFDYLKSELGMRTDCSNIIRLIRSATESCVIEDGKDEWYIFDNRDNSLVNACEKIFTLTDQCSMQALSGVLENSLRRRSNKYNYPDQSVIEKWIEKSGKFAVEGSAVSFLGVRGELTRVEQSVVEYLKQHSSIDYPSIKMHLLDLKYGEPTIVKALTTSPIVYVDKSAGRKAHVYRLVTTITPTISGSNDAPNRYQKFKNRLKRLVNVGTDVDAKTIARREQGVLQEWLFSDATVGICAICGGKYSTSALVAAHKKKRSLCTEVERLDPYIVFPLCVFGCDYLYENDIVRINNGKIQRGRLPKRSTVDRDRALELIGRTVPDEWIKGSSQYFSR